MPNIYGYAGLTYDHAGHAHQSVVQLTATADLLDTASIITQLQNLATLLGDCMNTQATIDGYVIYNSHHVLLASGLLTIPVVGTGAINDSHPNYESLTMTLTGKGPPQDLDNPGGTALLRWVCSGTFGQLTGLKSVVISDLAPLQAVATYLNGASLLFADFFGSKAIVRPQGKVQFNAALQRHLGS